MKISATIICKNEEECILDCLESVKELDEIVVCDTGSTDSTLQKVRELGWDHIRITTHPWADHFSEARNACLDFATGDWCVVIDADETISEGTVAALRTYLPLVETDAVRFECVSASHPDHVHYMVRAHRRAPHVRWQGRIHESLNVDGKRIPDARLVYGYSPAHRQDPDRALRLLIKDLEENPANTRSLYYLGREYFYRNQWQEAAEWLEKRCATVGFTPELADAWLYLARCRWALNQGEDARRACANALLVNANFTEALLFMSELHWPENAAAWKRFADKSTGEGVLFNRVAK